MSVRKIKATTPGQRFRIINNFEEITTSKPYKPLTSGIKKSGGRNNIGKMTIRYRGGGHKRKYRNIDFKRNKFNITAIVKEIEYDPNRSAFIALIEYEDNKKSYIIAPQNLKVGDKIISGDEVISKNGNVMKLKNIPLGSIISCIEMQPNQGAKIARSAGASAQLVARDGKYSTIKMPSGEIRLILSNCLAMIGSVSNSDHQLIVSGKAGRNRWLGKRPRTRPVAMNPVDHPMGGGEGKSTGGHPRSRNGQPSKGYKTRNKKKKSNKDIIQRRKK